MNTAYFEKYFSHVPASLVSGIFAVSITAIAIAIMIAIMMISVIIITPPGMA